MLQMIKDNPVGLVCGLANELVRRRQAGDITDLDHILVVLNAAAATAAYGMKARALLSGPLKKRAIEFEAGNWRGCAMALYGLWLGITPAEVEARMAELAKKDGDAMWRKFVPDENNIQNQQLLDFYGSLGPLEGTGLHEWNELALAIRWYVAETLAAAARGRGVFDFGGGDGVCCTFLRHMETAGVTLIEPTSSSRDFSRWINGELGITDIEYVAEPPRRKFGAGISMEVLEHVLDPLGMMKRAFEMLEAGGVMFVTSSFGVPCPQHLKSNLRWVGHEAELMRAAGFVPWTPPRPAAVPFLGTWGFWQRP